MYGVKMDCSCRKHKEMKHNMKPLSFYTEPAAYCARNIGQIAVKQKVECVFIKSVKQRDGTDEHHDAGNYVNSHCHGFQFFKEEKL